MMHLANLPSSSDLFDNHIGQSQDQPSICEAEVMQG